jgi:hypothetical protein
VEKEKEKKKENTKTKRRNKTMSEQHVLYIIHRYSYYGYEHSYISPISLVLLIHISFEIKFNFK